MYVLHLYIPSEFTSWGVCLLIRPPISHQCLYSRRGWWWRSSQERWCRRSSWGWICHRSSRGRFCRRRSPRGRRQSAPVRPVRCSPPCSRHSNIDFQSELGHSGFYVFKHTSQRMGWLINSLGWQADCKTYRLENWRQTKWLNCRCDIRPKLRSLSRVGSDQLTRFQTKL